LTSGSLEGKRGKKVNGEARHTAEASQLETATDETLGIKDGVAGVHRSLILCGIAD
jgi:hypothetical protein